MPSKITRFDYKNEHLWVYIFQVVSGLHSRKIRIVSNSLDDIKGKTVLDLGFGSGFYSRLCTERGANVVSLDHADCIVGCYKKSGGLNIVQGSCEMLPLKSNSFDLVLALDVIEHLYEPLSFLLEVNRVLNSKGKLILVTDNIDTLTTSLKKSIPHPLQPFLLSIYRLLVEHPAKILLSLRQKVPELPREIAINPPESTHVVLFGAGALGKMLRDCGFNVSKFGTFAETKCYDYLKTSISFLPFFKGRMWARVYFVCVKCL